MGTPPRGGKQSLWLMPVLHAKLGANGIFFGANGLIALSRPSAVRASRPWTLDSGLC